MSADRAMEYYEAIPRLRAQENMLMATAVAIGSGTLKQDAHRSIMRDWRQQAGELEVERQRQTPQEHLANLAAMGIAVEIVDG